MADLIDRQATVDRLKKERSFFTRSEQIGIGLDIARMIIEERVPSAQPEIVRCGECIAWDDMPISTFDIRFHRCNIHRSLVTANEYCSRGERRREDE